MSIGFPISRKIWLDLIDHIAPNQNRLSQNLTNGPKEIRPQLAFNNITLRDPLKISEQSTEI